MASASGWVAPAAGPHLRMLMDSWLLVRLPSWLLFRLFFIFNSVIIFFHLIILNYYYNYFYYKFFSIFYTLHVIVLIKSIFATLPLCGTSNKSFIIIVSNNYTNYDNYYYYY